MVNIPRYIKLHAIKSDNSDNIKEELTKSIVFNKEAILNTDGKTTFNSVKDLITLHSEKIDYKDKNHRLFWLNTIVGNIQNDIVGIYHGVTKASLPLFLSEQEWRFNHRYTGNKMMDKIVKYISKSTPITAKQLSATRKLALALVSS